MADSLAERYAKSVEYLARAEAVIPLGSQTFSKSRTQYPVGAAPLFAARSQGSHTWDIDGNEYVDLVCSSARWPSATATRRSTRRSFASFAMA